MEISEKLKNIYDLEYQAILNYFNIFLVSILAIFITIFFQSNLTLQYKLIITALLINSSILSIALFYNKYTRIKDKIMSL